MNTSFPAVESQVRCWCGHGPLEDWSSDYWRCASCQTLVVREMRGEEISQVRDDDHDFYGKNYYLRHIQEDYGLPDLETRARADLPERCLHWLRTLLKFVSGPGARTLELGCGHGGFVATQRWAGLDATGLELSPWLVQRARDWFGVPVLEGRLEDQGLAAASYDAVVLMDVLEHLPDPRRTLGQAVSLLRSPESFLLIQTPCYPVGWNYEALRAANHPFLTQLKPTEHLYLFSEPAVARLCAELGVGRVRFEPAIFAHYDLFAVASAGPLPERPLSERAAMLLAANPPARWTQAMLDLGEVRDDLKVRLVETASEATGLRGIAEAQGTEIARLHAEAHDFWPRLDAALNERNLAAAQLADLRQQFDRLENDGAARLQVIEHQGTELARLHAEANELWPKLDAAQQVCNLRVAELADLRQQFTGLESDHAARLQVIEAQGTELGELRARFAITSSELADLHGHHQNSEADRAARLQVIEAQGTELGELRARFAITSSELADLHGHHQNSEADRAARLQVIEAQGRELGELRAQLSLSRGELSELHGHYKASEADRAARLQVIEEQGAELGRFQSRLARNEAQQAALAADLDASRASRAALSGECARLATDLSAARDAHAALAGEHARLTAAANAERARLVTDLNAMNAAHAALAADHEALGARHKKLNKHWTARALKSLRLWPL